MESQKLHVLEEVTLNQLGKKNPIHSTSSTHFNQRTCIAKIGVFKNMVFPIIRIMDSKRDH